MRLKSADRALVRRWRREQETLGYLPHFHRVGRIKMEVRFLSVQPRDGSYKVVNLVTGECLRFRRNGTPLNGSRGVMIGALILKRKIRNV